MSTDLFDFDDNIDNLPESADTTPKEVQKSGKRSGKASGAIVRSARVPMHVRQPLSAGERKGFKRRIFNDDPNLRGRIERAKLAGWSVVSDGTVIGDPREGKAHVVDGVAAVPVGGGKWGVLMEIPLELYEEDRAAKSEMVREREKAMVGASSDAAKQVGPHTAWFIPDKH
jgi:hypothetical protein